MPRKGLARPNRAPAGAVGFRQWPEVLSDKWLYSRTPLLASRGSKDCDPERKSGTRSPRSPAGVLLATHPKSTTSQRVEESHEASTARRDRRCGRCHLGPIAPGLLHI